MASSGNFGTSYRIQSTLQKSTTTTKKVLNIRGGANGANKPSNVPAFKPTTTGASIPNEIFNLVKAIVGVGVLSLPAGVAAFGNAPSAIVPAIVLIGIIGILSAFGFSTIGRVCSYTGATSYKEAWSLSVGEESSWIPGWSTTIKTFMACTAFSMVLADTFSALLGTQRTPTLVALTGLVLLPLCLLKDLSSLAPFSLLGVLGMGYTAIAMAVRYLDGTYKLPGGSLVTQVAENLQPSFGEKGMEAVLSAPSLILVCMLSTAYLAHFNAAKFYIELKNNTMQRFNRVVSWSFGISILLMGTMAALGFLTFGENSAGLVLNNYSTNDLWMSGSRIAVAISLVFSYPLAFTGCRDGLLALLKSSDEQRSPMQLNIITVALLSVITLLACTLKDVSFVLAFAGATLGNALTYVYPAIMYRAVVKNQGREGESGGVAFAMSSAVLGIIMGAIGAVMAWKNK